MSLLTDTAAAITAAVPAETNVYPSNAEPPTPDNLLTLYDLGGPQGALNYSGAVQEERTVQCRIRDLNQQACQDRTAALYAALRAWYRYPPAFLRMRAATQPLFTYPRDANGRSIASFTIQVIRGE